MARIQGCKAVVCKGRKRDYVVGQSMEVRRRERERDGVFDSALGGNGVRLAPVLRGCVCVLFVLRGFVERARMKMGLGSCDEIVV